MDPKTVWASSTEALNSLGSKRLNPAAVEELRKEIATEEIWAEAVRLAAHQERLGRDCELVPLTMLAPDLVEAMYNARHPDMRDPREVYGHLLPHRVTTMVPLEDIHLLNMWKDEDFRLYLKHTIPVLARVEYMPVEEMILHLEMLLAPAIFVDKSLPQQAAYLAENLLVPTVEKILAATPAREVAGNCSYYLDQILATLAGEHLELLRPLLTDSDYTVGELIYALR